MMLHLKPQKQESGIYADAVYRQIIFSNYGAAAFLRETIIALCMGRTMPISSVIQLDRKHYALFLLILDDYRKYGETRALREITQQILQPATLL